MEEILTINKRNFYIEERYPETITIPDCFVKKSNQLGSAHGEAKLYFGTKEMMRKFFGKQGFNAKCFVFKQDLLVFLEAIKKEYDYPMFDYHDKKDFSRLWKSRMAKVKAQDEFIYFSVEDQCQIEGSRGYVKSENKEIGYELIREISLPLVSCLLVMRLRDEKGGVYFYWQPFVDYNYFEDKANAFVFTYGKNKGKKKYKRIGQGKFRDLLLKECGYCPITHVSERAILMASHIKPWRNSSKKEKTDPKNGFLLSPLYDKLFDKGLITFSDTKELIISKWLSLESRELLKLNTIKVVDDLPLDEERKKYLEYHRRVVFLH